MSADRPKTLAILGGSFDPIHIGHIRVADAVEACLGLDGMVLMLAPRPPHKDPSKLSDLSHRAAMVEIALKDRPAWSQTSVETDRSGTSYTIDSLRALRNGNPPMRPVFVMGMDSLLHLPKWRQFHALIGEFDFAVVERPGCDLISAQEQVHPAVAERLQLVHPKHLTSLDIGAGGRIFVVPVEPIELSSSQIRDIVAAGQSVDDLVPPGVARYIHSHHLYREEESPLTQSLPEAVRRAAEAASDQKALDIAVLDLVGLSDVTDHFVICHGASERQVSAIANHIEETLRKDYRIKPASVEGRRGGQWVLMDYIDFVVHVFHEEKREFYRLERLWGDAPRHELGLPEDDLPGTRRRANDEYDDFEDEDDDSADDTAAV